MNNKEVITPGVTHNENSSDHNNCVGENKSEKVDNKDLKEKDYGPVPIIESQNPTRRGRRPVKKNK